MNFENCDKTDVWCHNVCSMLITHSLRQQLIIMYLDITQILFKFFIASIFIRFVSIYLLFAFDNRLSFIILFLSNFQWMPIETDQQITNITKRIFKFLFKKRMRHTNMCSEQTIMSALHTLNSMAKFEHQICVKLLWMRSNIYRSQLLLLYSSVFIYTQYAGIERKFSTPQWFHERR